MSPPPESSSPDDPPPEKTPGEENPTNERIAWVLVGMVFLAVFVWPALFQQVPSGTVAALITALTTLVLARRVNT